MEGSFSKFSSTFLDFKCNKSLQKKKNEVSDNKTDKIVQKNQNEKICKVLWRKLSAWILQIYTKEKEYK